MRIAIIGTGISGCLAARLLSTRHEVTVFEANDYAGGHANTVDVSIHGKSFAVDTGFMVYNRRTYPNFCRLLEILEVTSQKSDMSFGVRCSRTGLEYQGSSLNGLFAQRLNCLRSSFLRMLADIARFNRRARAAVASGELKDGKSVGEFLRECRVGQRFVEHYLVPMAAAIWSSNPQNILNFPAEFMIGFFANHGLIQILDRPQWYTIVGGSRKYISALLEPIQNRIRLCCPIQTVTRTHNAVIVTTAIGSSETFDQVVFGCHADQALGLLADATCTERQILGDFPYQPNEAVLHTDLNLLPRRRSAWASWNYHIFRGEERTVSVTYNLSRLQNLDSGTPILLTLNATKEIDKSQILRKFHYSHPAFSHNSIKAQQRFSEISGRNRTHYCGAYWGYGFHEDGVNSALAVAKQFGIELRTCKVKSTKELSPIVAFNR